MDGGSKVARFDPGCVLPMATDAVVRYLSL